MQITTVCSYAGCLMLGCLASTYSESGDTMRVVPLDEQQIWEGGSGSAWGLAWFLAPYQLPAVPL